MNGMKVSILIAVYNEASTVDELLERVLESLDTLQDTPGERG